MEQKLVKYVEKPWGYEKWIAVTKQYALKEIYLAAGKQCSLHYHLEKEEHSYLLQGKVAVEEEDGTGALVTNVYGPGECWHEKPLARHRVMALEDSIFMEVSTAHLDDVVRIER